MTPTTYYDRVIAGQRAFWAEIAKKNGWYTQPFFVQVWIEDETADCIDSVSWPALDHDIIIRVRPDGTEDVQED